MSITLTISEQRIVHDYEKIVGFRTVEEVPFMIRFSVITKSIYTYMYMLQAITKQTPKHTQKQLIERHYPFFQKLLLHIVYCHF